MTRCAPGCGCGRHQWGNRNAVGARDGCPPGCGCGKHNNLKYVIAIRRVWAQRYADPVKMAAYLAAQRAARENPGGRGAPEGENGTRRDRRGRK